MKKMLKTSLAAILLLVISCTKQNSTAGSAITAQSEENAVTTRYHIGDTLGGGIVIYLDSTKMHGLIAAVQKQGRTKWYN
jgi:hypothetical protein